MSRRRGAASKSAAFYKASGGIIVSKVDFGTGIALMGLSGTVFFIAKGMPTVPRGIGPGGYPIVIAVILFVLGLALTLQNLPRKALATGAAAAPAGKSLSWKLLKRPFLISLVVFAYIRGLFFLGFVFLTPFFLFFTIWFFGYRRWLRAAIISIVTTGIIYAVFYYGFQVLLPRFNLF
jgi:putative tricarboxylic transport membrane protein